MKNPIVFICIALACYSCSSTSLMSLSVIKPAPVSIPPNIKSVAIVNRTQASNETKTLDAIHKAVSLETNDLQVAGAQSSIQGLSDELMKNNRFTLVKSLNGIDLRSYGAGVFPTPLLWDSVERICRESNTDALFALELFDAESRLNYAGNPANVNLGGINLPAIEHLVNMTTNVKTGWRIYDPSTRTILDEYIIGRDLSSSGSSINPAVAASAFIGRKEAVKEVGIQAGQAYASRILPYWIRVSRDYFVGGDQNFKTAQRRAQSGNWDGAAQIWLEETKSTDWKLAGRGCYNMAIISEINGDLDGAIQWAQKSYEDYKIRLGLNYVNILRYRKQQNDLLKSQSVASVTQ
ncbi:MAG TPA: DUF6340 family protein [Puia sp.]|jgi:hypothetical protein|nr:DUF6340 family protein [Puia sp.]